MLLFVKATDLSCMCVPCYILNTANEDFTPIWSEENNAKKMKCSGTWQIDDELNANVSDMLLFCRLFLPWSES